MHISKLALAVVFPLIMGSGAAVANELPWKSVYVCDTVDDVLIKVLDEKELLESKKKYGKYFHFLTNGEFIIKDGSASIEVSRWETYGPVEYPLTWNSNERINSLIYNDLGEFHEFILTKVGPVGNGYDWHERILIDKELMEGFSTFTDHIGSAKERERKERFVCEQVYPNEYS